MYADTTETLACIDEDPSKHLLQGWTDIKHALIAAGHGPYPYKTIEAASSTRDQAYDDPMLREYLTDSTITTNLRPC
jgi:hypothetical protein